MHLEMAEAIKTAVSTRNDKHGRLLHQQLLKNWSPFYLGQIAPDFSFLDKIKREETHFYAIPLTEKDDPVAKMLQTYPFLKDAQSLPVDQCWFIAGYLAHLLYDQFWFLDIITPTFWHNKTLGDRQHRRLVHLLLLCAMDAAAYERLPESSARILGDAHPAEWLPFGTDQALVQWQGMVAEQLTPGGEVKTLQILSPRAELDVESFSTYFYDQAWMATHVDTAVSVQRRAKLIQKTCAASIDLLIDYLFHSPN